MNPHHKIVQLLPHTKKVRNVIEDPKAHKLMANLKKNVY